MARKKAEKIDPEERARLKKLRALQRREERKKRRAEGGSSRSEKIKAVPADYSEPMVRDSYEWIRRSMAQSYAWKIVNNHRERPYWLSIKFAGGNPPVSHFYPCTTFRRGERYFYGFLFQECRDEVFKEWCKEFKARKHFTGPDGRPLT